MKTFRIEPVNCPVCNHRLASCASVTNSSLPKPHDWLVCGGCTSVLRYDEDMRLRSVEWLAVPLQLRYTIGKVRFAAQLQRASRN